MLLVITLALFSVYPAESEQCVAPDDQQKSILRNIKGKLSDRSLNPHPMALIALRMGIDHDLQMEQNILRRLSEMVVQKAEAGERFPIDLIASCILAFRSSCSNAAKISAGNKEVNLVKMLRESLYREIHQKSMIAASNENTRDSLKAFTEVSLAILVLCQEEEYVHRFIIYKFARVHLRNIFQHAGKLTVDTMATTALTLRCLITSQQPRGRPRLEIAKALMRIIRWILSKVREDGTIGSLNSTGLAMQALAENINVYISRVYNCSKSVQKMVHEFSQGNIENLRTVSQVAIALGGKSLLDVNKIPCPVYKVTTMTTLHSTINGLPTRTASPSTLLINSSTLNQRIEPIPTHMRNSTIPPTSVHSMSMDTFSSLLRGRVIPSSTAQPLNPTPSLMTSKLPTTMGSWTNATARIINSATVPILNSAVVPIVNGEIVPMVTSGIAHIGNSKIVPIRNSVPTLARTTAPIMTNRAVLTVTSETSPIMSSDVAPVPTSRAANNTSEAVPGITSETAHIVSSETVPIRTSETAHILSSRTENIVYRETASIMASGTVFNVTRAPVSIVTNEAVNIATREANHSDH